MIMPRVRLGRNFWAGTSGGNDNEQYIGRWIRGSWHDWALASGLGSHLSVSYRQLNHFILIPLHYFRPQGCLRVSCRQQQRLERWRSAREFNGTNIPHGLLMFRLSSFNLQSYHFDLESYEQYLIK